MRVRQWWPVLAIIFLTVVAGVVYLGTARSITDGRPVAPLDDAYITFQYARQMARGHPAVTSSHTRVTLRVDAENADFRHYAPYYFWFLQGEAKIVSAEAEHRVSAVFGGEIRLLGFDLPVQECHPGDTSRLRSIGRRSGQRTVMPRFSCICTTLPVTWGRSQTAGRIMIPALLTRGGLGRLWPIPARFLSLLTWRRGGIRWK